MDSLFSICLNFISQNLHQLESLEEFPEQIGRQIYQRCVENRCFDKLKVIKSSVHPLEPFFRAYEDCGVLENLNLNNQLAFLNDTFERWPWIYSTLVRLDLGNCGLGDDHEVLPILPTFPRLQTLVLASNSLSNEAIRKFTLKCRMFSSRNVSLLKYIDISNNNLTSRMFEYLRCLKHLEVLKVSQSVLNDEISLHGWQSHNPNCKQCCQPCVVTSGWAGAVMTNWMQEFQSEPNEKIKNHSQKGQEAQLCLPSLCGENAKSTTFYSRKTKSEIKTSEIDSNIVKSAYLSSRKLNCDCVPLSSSSLNKRKFSHCDNIGSYSKKLKRRAFNFSLSKPLLVKNERYYGNKDSKYKNIDHKGKQKLPDTVDDFTPMKDLTLSQKKPKDDTENMDILLDYV